MADSEKIPFQLPEANDKLPFKFILDAQREAAMKKLFLESPPFEEEGVPAAQEVVTTNETMCGKLGSEVDPAQSIPIESVAAQELLFPEGKKYFRIGEVSELIGVEPYVLRYWESEFRTIRPTKSSSGQRVYSCRDVETLHEIKNLLHIQKFSIKGAKQRLLEKKREGQTQESPAIAKDRDSLKQIYHEAKELLSFIRSASA